MYNDTEEMATPHNTTHLDITPTTHSIPDLSSETATGYSEDTYPKRDLVQLQEHFQLLQKISIN